MPKATPSLPSGSTTNSQPGKSVTSSGPNTSPKSDASGLTKPVVPSRSQQTSNIASRKLSAEAFQWKFAKALVARRKQQQLSQSGLAYLAGVSESMISYLETGTRWPSVATFIKIMETLDMKPSEMFKEIGL